MKYIILLFLSLFATSLPIISFSQMDDSAHPKITQQIPSTNTQSQPSYLILATIIITITEVPKFFRFYRKHSRKDSRKVIYTCFISGPSIT